jgi:ABC-type nickel/cobalt efflux system permease component RcnA
MENIDPILKALEEYLPTIISFITTVSANPWAAGIFAALIGAVAWYATWRYGKKRRDRAIEAKNRDLQRNQDDLENNDASADRSIRDRMRRRRRENEKETE